MNIETMISVEEYLNTSYDPDVEYIDGVLVERNVGDWLHSLIQRNIVVALTIRYPHLFAMPELCSQTRSTRYRLPDVSVLLSRPDTRYLLNAAFLAIEILSEDDKMTRVMEKLEEYQQKGVAHIWLIDPRLQKMSTYAGGVLREVVGDRIATIDPVVELTREEIFRQA